MVEQRPPDKLTPPRGLPIVTAVLTTLAFLLYWILAHQIQGVNLQGWLPPSVDRLINDYPLFDPLLPIIDFVVEMASPTVLLHLFALGFGYYLARQFAIELVRKLYGLPDTDQAVRLLTRLQVPPNPAFSRPLALDRRRFLEQRRNEPILSIGGPGYVNISESDVAVTEINGRFERVLGYGRKTLRRFERIVAVLDLRDQENSRKNVVLMTKEALPLKTDLHIQYRLKRRESTRANLLGYTFDEESVRRAAYHQVVTTHGINRWNSLPINIAVGQLNAIVAQKRLDELIDPNKVYELAPQPDIQQQLKVRVQQILGSMGLEMVDVRYTGLRLSDEMESVMLDYWKSFGKRPPNLSPLPQGDGASFEAIMARRAREKMIKSLASGVSTVRERKLAALARPDNGQQSMQQMMTLLQGILSQQHLQQPQQPVQIQRPDRELLGAPPSDARYLLSLRRDNVNHLVWQLLGELDVALRATSPLSSEQLYLLMQSARLKLRMRDAVTSFATLSVGSADESSVALQTAELTHASYDTLVIDQSMLAEFTQELIREATRSVAEEINLPMAQVAQWLKSIDLDERFLNAVAQHFLPTPQATTAQLQHLMQSVLGSDYAQSGELLLTLSRGKVSLLVEQLVRDLEATTSLSSTLDGVNLGGLGRSTRLRLRMRETITFQANPSASTPVPPGQVPALDVLIVQMDELDILAKQLVWETSVTAEEELALTSEQAALIVQSAELFSRYKNTVTRHFTPPPGETPPQIHRHIQMALRQRQMRRTDRLLVLQRSQVNNLVWQLIKEFEDVLRHESYLTASHARGAVRTPNLQLLMRETVTFQAKPAIATALRSGRYSVASSQQMETVHRLPKYDTLIVPQVEVKAIAKQLINGAAVSAIDSLGLSPDNITELNESAELSNRFQETITQFFQPLGQSTAPEPRRIADNRNP